ncbi:MAG: YggS family pyridoxal phosphate-dependent enzyme [Gammaproteobacteria bacterium]
MTDLSESEIRARLDRVRERISHAARDAGRAPDSIGLLAVSKTKPAAAVRAAHACGQIAFGENYLQDALAKQDALEDLALEWHFIGPIQSNKTRDIATRFDWVHTVERAKIARRLNDQRPDEQPPLNVCIQVNISAEASKSGIAPTDVADLAACIAKLPRLRLRGLMAIPARAATLDEQRAPLRALAELRDALCARGYDLDTLSMGMSGDLEAAILEGSTLVRVGTDVFGARTP